MRYLRLFKVKKEELWASLIALVAFIVLHILLISKYFDLFSDPKAHFWDVFIKNFRMSGFDPITYAVTTEWGTFYNVYRHPLLAFFVWPFYAINQGLTALFGINLVQLVIALPLLFFSYYTFIFIYRIFREVIGISRTDSTVLSALFFSFAYTIVTFIVPDHFAITCFMLVTTLYLSGKCIQKGRHLNR
ncbi:MAG: GtrA family protein, partial [Prevotella sp.]|nr:GtrA family protein [Prevotella sp.]